MASTPKIPPKIPSDLGPLLALGWGIAAWITVGVLLGRWADSHWGSQPWGTLAGALGGIAGSGWTVYRVVRHLDDRDRDRQNSDESARARDKTTGSP